MLDLVPTRWIFAIMGNLGILITYVLKVNLSVGILAMVNHTEVAQNSYDFLNNSANICDDRNLTILPQEDGPYIWDDHIQGVVLASYFYGYILTQVPGGVLAEKFSAKSVFGFGVFLNAIFTLLIPLAASISYILVAVMRIGTGITAGIGLPSMNVLISRWASVDERNKMTSTVYSGMSLGILLGLPLSGLLASSVGWENMFYIEGASSLIWCFAWIYLVYDFPEIHPRITDSEKNLLRKYHISEETSPNFNLENKRMSVPWINIWTSKAVWSIIIIHFCANLNWYLLLTKLPTYMKYILHFDIKTNSLLSSIPYICMVAYSFVLAFIFDIIMSKNVFKTLTLRKFATFLGILIPSTGLVFMTFVGCNTTAAVTLLSIATMLMGSNISGFLSNHIDIAPKFAGTLMGITNMIGTIPGIFVPSVIGAMTHGNQKVEVWRQFFYGITLFNIFGTMIFFIFASSEEQKWAKPKCDNDEEKRLKE